MDISSLLSPGPESPSSSRSGSRASPRSQSVNSTPSPHGNPHRPSTQPRKSSGLSQQVTYATTPPRSFAEDHRQDRTGPSIATSYATSSPSLAPARSHPSTESRVSSSPSVAMDALAEVASRQRPQTIAQQHNNSSTSTGTQSASSRSAVDAVMPDAPPGPDSYDFASLSPEVYNKLAGEAKRVADNPFDITAHTSLVETLHSEFCRYVESGKDADTFEPVNAMRQARQAMDKIFPVGEDLWIGWLTDENLLCRTIDDRINVMDLHLRSVLDEPSSAPLWRRYGDYMYYLWSASNAPVSGWSENDRLIGQEVFKWETMIDVWEQGVARTQWHLNDSNLVWDRYMEILINDLSKESTPEKISAIREKFIDRLTTKSHATWDQTSQAFSEFLSKHDPDSYEDTMLDIVKRSAKVKQAYAMRETFEFKIQQAQDSSDRDAEWAVYMEYLAWEIRMKGIFSVDLINGLYERATTRFSTDANIWVDYVEFLIESPVKDIPVLSVLERATRHCPWSGDLWSHRLLEMECEGKGFEEIEEAKHKATASGLVDINGLEDLMKVYIAWCGYLRRRAFSPGASEDEMDMAEMGIRSSIEHAVQAGQKKYGSDFKGDPQYRLERIHMKFLFQRNDTDGVIALWQELIPRAGNNYDFWNRYYILAMIIWSRIMDNFEPGKPAPPPRDATHILEMAMQRIDTLDWPEQLVPMYMNHCEQHETVQVYKKALIEVRRAKKRIEDRREKERAAWTEQQATVPATAQSEPNSKRKRSDEATLEDPQTKKIKSDDIAEGTVTEEIASPASPAQPKRDRENTTLIVRNLPPDVSEIKVRQFFRDCGTINDIHFYEESGKKTAMVEFESKEDALYAQTKVTKPFDGQEISIEFSTGSTLWVTNYPPTADKKYIQNLFDKYGEIVEVRFPSLQGNTHRRFCYVQFLSPSSALKATGLDGQVLDGVFHLHAKISDPSRKEDRHGAMYDGREIFIRNIHYGTTEKDVKEFFSQCGTIEKARVPTNLNGKGKGVAFVVFKNKDSADKAVEKFNNTLFKSRTIAVEISAPKGKRTETVIRQRTVSATPDPESLPDAPSTNGEALNSDARTYRERTLAILDLADTVNSARLEKLVEPYGAIKKISLRPDHGGAFIEFSEQKGVGVASLALEGIDLDGKKLRIGTVAELLQQKPEEKISKITERPKERNASKKSGTFGLGSGVVSRPGQVGARRGGRGGLGKKTGLGFGRSNEGQSGGKTNAEFRDMFLKETANGKAPTTENS